MQTEKRIKCILGKNRWRKGARKKRLGLEKEEHKGKWRWVKMEEDGCEQEGRFLKGKSPLRVCSSAGCCRRWETGEDLPSGKGLFKSLDMKINGGYARGRTSPKGQKASYGAVGPASLQEAPNFADCFHRAMHEAENGISFPSSFFSSLSSDCARPGPRKEVWWHREATSTSVPQV